MSRYEPGSPEWFLEREGRALTDLQPRYDYRWSWYSGDPPLPQGYRRYKPLLRNLQRYARTGYMSLVVDSPVERMALDGFRLRGATEADEWLGDVWEANELDLGSNQAHLEAGIFGSGYVMVSPAAEDSDTGFPVITVEDPRTTFVEMDPARPGKPLVGLRRWIDDVDEVAYSILYVDDKVYTYVADAKTVMELSRDVLDGTGVYRVNDPQTWELADVGDNPIGEVPITRLLWRPTRGEISRGEMDGCFDLAERINNTVLDRLIIQKASAYKQRWAAGIKPQAGEKGGVKPPWDPGADILWVTDKADAKFGEFSESDIRQVLDAVQADVRDLAAITKTPPHYLLANIVNVSGDALKAAETGLVSKTWDRMHTVEIGWKRAARLALKAAGKPSDGRIEVDWKDPESRSRAELADAALKESTIGVPFSLLLERLGYSPEQIKQAKEERDAEETRKLLLDAQRAETMARFAPQPQAGDNRGGKSNPDNQQPGVGNNKTGDGANVRAAKGQPTKEQQTQAKPPKSKS